MGHVMIMIIMITYSLHASGSPNKSHGKSVADVTMGMLRDRLQPELQYISQVGNFCSAALFAPVTISVYANLKLCLEMKL